MTARVTEDWIAASRTSLLVVGVALWALAEPSLATFHGVLALVAGATIPAIFREEIPSAKEARAGACFGGVTVFGALIQAPWRL